MPCLPRPASSLFACLQRVQRASEQEVEEARREMQKSGRELGSTSEYLAGVMNELAVSCVLP